MVKTWHSGYLIKVWTAGNGEIIYKISYPLESQQMKTRRLCSANKFTGKLDRTGKRIYTRFENEDQALTKAKNYIDNIIKPSENGKDRK